MTELPVSQKEPVMHLVLDAAGKMAGEIASVLREPASRAGLAACVITTGLLARSRMPFPVVLGISLIAGDIAEKAYDRYLSDADGD